jgi:hypothetical protein
MASLSLLIEITSLNLLMLLLEIVDVCHRTRYFKQVVEGLELSKCLRTDSYRKLFHSRPSSLLVPHLTTTITCLYSRH